MTGRGGLARFWKPTRVYQPMKWPCAPAAMPQRLEISTCLRSEDCEAAAVCHAPKQAITICSTVIGLRLHCHDKRALEISCNSAEKVCGSTVVIALNVQCPGMIHCTCKGRPSNARLGYKSIPDSPAADNVKIQSSVSSLRPNRHDCPRRCGSTKTYANGHHQPPERCHSRRRLPQN